MKFKILLLALVISTVSIAQEISAPEPDFEGEIVFVTSENKHQELEMVTTSVKRGQSVGRIISGIGKVKARVIAKGKTSTTKIKKSENLYFIYNHGSNNILPTKIIQLLEFKTRKKYREYLIASSSNVSGQTDTGVLDLIKFRGKKYGKGSYLIKVSNLEPGEYAFFVGSEETQDGFFFTVTD
ncbi:hypothetical protein IMCC3317_44710 [Kordia antarctica]|uniref:Uncharacterized protein n=1 Tax=Kordia antarctica TaxID=1218801 RepID=A0A7L4ZRH0_9FLAO|nr:hypothetical protein [Kordia antarctica]QHI39070.1 hypothetical protein IMCC3317_44710 [Kordia antarctica]